MKTNKLRRVRSVSVSRRSMLRGSAAVLGVSAVGIMNGCRTTGLVSSLEPQFNTTEPWHKAREIVDAIQAPVIPKKLFNIVDYGARPGWQFDALPAVNKAIAACKSAGGGQIVIPDGNWQLEGPIHFISHMELHLLPKAHIRFSGNAQRYLPLVRTRWEGTEVYNYSPMIYAFGCHNIAITGKGKIDGQGKAHFLPWRKQQKPDQRSLRNMGRDGVPVEQRVFGEGHFLRPHFIQFYECRHILVDGPEIIDSPFWCVHPVYCDQVIVRNIRIDSEHLNSDGVDPDSSQNVLIENCSFNVGDDGVAIKAGRDQDGWRVGRKSQNIVVRNCEYTGDAGGGVAIGSEMSGGVTDVYVENYQIPECRHMLYFKANKDRGGEISRVYIRNIQSRYAEAVIIFTNDYHSYRGGNFPTVFKDVLMENVTCQRSKVALHIFGNETAPVENVVLRDININDAEVAAQIKHTRNLQMDNVRINGSLMTPELAQNLPILHKPKM